MGLIFVMSLFVLGSGGVFVTFRRLRRTQATRAWWFAFGALAAVGLVAGCWLAFRFEYQVSSQIRCASFPMPLALFHLEHGQWIDFVTPPHVMYPGLVANVIAVVALALLPLWLASLAVGRSRGRWQKPPKA